MGLIELITRVSQDADPGIAGFQPQAAYVLLCIAFPLVVGLATSALTALIPALLRLRQRREEP
jgi:ABC-type uncharacterized transport system permease subunit